VLRQGDRCPGLVCRFATCFVDRPEPRNVEHQVKTLIGQCFFGLAWGYERRPLNWRSTICSPIAPPPPPCRSIRFACGSRPWSMFPSIPCAVSVGAILSSPMPRLRPFVSTSSSSGRRCEPVCGALTLPSPRDARTRLSSNSPATTFGAPSVRLAPRGKLKTPGFATRRADVCADRSRSRVTKSYHSRVSRT
jgi:hypothetical protein